MSTVSPMHKAPKRERGKVRVEALLDAAAFLFSDRGYGATTMTEIAARAEASIGSLYQFFPSKEALAEALFARYEERAAASVHALSAIADELSAEALADFLVDLMVDLRSDRNAAVALSNSVAGIVERRQPLRDAMRHEVASILRARCLRLTEQRADAVAWMITQVMKVVPALAPQENSGQGSAVFEARRILSLYIADALAS